MNRFVWMFAVCLSIACLGHTSRTVAQEPEAKTPPASTTSPWFVDDEKFFHDFIHKLGDFANHGKCLSNEQMIAKLNSGTKPKIALTKPSDKVLSSNEVYQSALPSVFILGSVHKHKVKEKDKEEWRNGMYATAWVAAADGVLVTNWHVFEDLKDSEVFGAVDHKGNVYPLIDFLGGDKAADVAIVRIDAKGLKPLPLAETYPEIGSWVGVLSHPGDNYFVFTQGHVTRYSSIKNEDGILERLMGLTAEYAYGSSGGPVLDKCGAVVGMAASAITIDGTPAAPNLDRRRFMRGQPLMTSPPQDKPDAKAPAKPEQKPGAGSSVQIVLKMAVPGPIIYKTFAKP
jgi:serine protease Do